MKPVILHPEAEVELETEADFYEGREVGLGEDFRAAVGEALRQIEVTPSAFSPYKGGPVRRVLLRRFPFGVYFVERDSVIYVLAVANQRRQPDYWLSRLGDV